MRAHYVWILPLVALPASLGAEDGSRFHPPPGCTEVLTVQSRSCEVDLIYTCESDLPGESWRIVFDAGGAAMISKIDAETQWLESYDLMPMTRQTLVQPAEDPASLRELLETGLDSYDFTMTGDDGLERVVGFDRLTGEEVEIDGEPLLRTEFSSRHIFSDSSEVEVSGNQFVSVSHQRFISGTWRVQRGETVMEDDNSPIDFIYPGEPGFFETTPLYDCEAHLASYALPAGDAE